MNTLLLILLVVVLIAAFGGFYGRPHYGPVSFGPLGLILVVLLILWLLGYLR